MEIKVTINKYAEGRSSVPSTQGGNGTDLISTATETWYGTTPIVNVGSALEDSGGEIKTFASSLPTSITKVGTRYLNTIYWKEEGTAYLSEAPTDWEYNGTKNIIINLYYGKTSGSTNYKPSDDELGPVTPPPPTSWNLTVNVKKDNSTTKNLDVTHYGSVGVSTSTMKVTYYTGAANTSQKVHTIDLPAGYKISSVTVNNNSISSEQTFSKQDVTVQYTLVKDEYTVTLNNQSATTAGTSSVTATYGFAMPSATMPQKTGYTFDGYYTGTNGSGTQYYKADGSSAMNWNIRSNTTLYAKWTANTYTVTLNNQSATTAGATTVTATYGSAMPSIVRKLPKKTGHTFGGYYTGTNGSGTQYYKANGTSARSWDKTTATTLYAKWTANKYTVTLNNQSATIAGTSSVTATYGSAMPSATMPQKTGYTFGGYYTGTNGSGTQYYKADGSSARSWDKTTATTLYAKWTAKTATITWNANGGTCTTTLSSYTYDGDTVSLPTPSRTGYTFNGWYTAATGGTKITEIGTTNKPTSNVTYYAQWSIISYTINYYIDGVKDTSLGNPATYTVETSTITLKNPTKSNYTGSGWRLNGTSGAQYTQIVKGSTGNKTFYWTWTANSYTIIYKDQGNKTFSGTHASGYPTKHTYGTKTTLKTATKTGYTFGGWFTSSDCSGTAVTSLSATGYTSAITLYAKWTATNYTITYNTNGGNSIAQKTYTIETATFNLPEPTRDGYTFKGWYSNGSFSGSTTTQIVKGSTGNRIYYAKWEGNPCTITVNANPSYLSGYVSGGKSCKVGDSVTISASLPGDYIKFNSWTYGNTFISSSNPYTFTATGTRTYTGNFTDYRQKITFKFHVNPQYYTDTPDSIVDIFYGNTRTELSTVRRTSNGSNIVYEFDHSTDVTVNRYAGGSGTYLSSINNSLNSQDMYILPTSLGGNNLVGIYIGKNPTSDSETYKENELVLDVYYGKLPSFSTPGGTGGGSGSSIPSKQLKVRFNYWIEGVKLEKGTATWESKWGGYTPPEEIETWWIQYNGFEQDKKDYNKNRIHFTHHEIGDYNYNNITDTPTQIQEKLEIQAPINCYVDSVTGFDDNDLSKEYNTLTNTGEYFDVDINYKNVTYLARATSNDISRGNASVNGSGTNGSSDVAFIIGQQLTFNASPKTGYKFTKWVNKNNTSQEYTTNPYIIENAPATNVHYEAYFGPIEYTITLNPNGGSGSQLAVKIDYYSTLTKSTIKNPTRTGYTFNGWYTASNGGYLVVGTDGKLKSNVSGYTDSSSRWIKASNTTLYAQWTAKTITITWNANGGNVSPTTSTYIYDGAAVTLPTPTRTGYTFNGWYTAASGGTKVTEIGTTNKPADNVIYYAQWTANSYTIIYKDQGNKTFSGTHASGYPTKHTYGTKTTLKTATKTGYTFGGWFTSSNCSGTALNSLSAAGITSNIILYAKWTTISYTITYHINGGTCTNTPSSYTIETADFNLPTPTKSGYTFIGWYDNDSFTGTPITKITKGSTGDKSYYAKWEGNPCTITVNANPSELTSRLTGGGNYKIGDSITITAPSEYDVYKFKNWTKNNSVVSTSTTYNFTANGNATYVANFIDNRKSALFKIHILDDSYNETGLCNVEIKYGNLDNSSDNSIKRTDDRIIEIEGTTSICSVTKTHISGTNFSDKVNGTLTSQVFYAFPESINNEPFINILYNGKEVESEDLYTNNSLEFDVYYGNMPKNDPGDGPGDPGDSDNSEIIVRFKYYLDGEEIDTSNAAYISWPSSNIDELKCYWFKYDSYTKNDRELAITGITDRIKFSYVDTYWGDPAKSDPYSNLKYVLEIQAPSFTGLADPVFLSGVDIHDTNKTYTYSDCPNNLLDICIYFESYEFNAYVYSNLPEYGDAYIAHKGTTQAPFYASSVNPTAIRFDAEVLNDAYEFNCWVNYNDKDEVALSTKNPWVIQRPEARDYHIEAIFTGRQLNVALDPNDGTAHAWWQHVGIVAGTKRFKTVSFNLDEDVRKPSDRTGYEFLGWYTSETNNNGSGYLIIDKNGNLQANVPGWTTSDGLWIKGPTVDTSECYHNVIVYAKWKPIEYTITYKDQGGGTFSGKHANGYPTKHTYGSTTTLKDPTKTENTFGGWFTNSSCTGNPITSIGPEDYTTNITLYAKWIVNKYTLTWDLKGGTVTKAGTCAPLNSTGIVSGQVDYLSSITAPIVSKNGYTFSGWKAENGNGLVTPVSKMPNGNLKYIAVYSTKTYKISVNSIPTLDKVYIKVNDILKGTSTTCTTNDKITLIAENTDEYLLSYWQKSGGNVVSGQNVFTFTANDTYLDDTVENNIFTAYYNQDPRATLKINFIVDDFIEKTAIFKFNETFSFLGDSSTEGYRCEIQGEEECIEGDISINQGYFFIPSKYNGEDLCMVPHEQGSGTSKLICSNKGITIGRDGNNSQYYEDNTVKNKYCPTEFEWQAYLPTNVADETHLVFPAVEKDEYGILYGPLVIDVYYGEIPERFLPVIPDDIEITKVSGLTLLQRIQNKIATFKWLNNLFGEPEKTTWDSYDNSGLKSFLKDDSKETPSSIHCIEYGDLQIYNQNSDNENINLDKTIKQYSLTLDNIIKPLNGQVVLDVSKIEGNKIYFNISNLSGFTNTSNGIYIYFSVNNETDENNATLYKMKLPKTSSNKGLLLTIPDVSNIESLYIYRTPIMVDSTKTGITPKIYFSSEKGDLTISVHDRTTLNTVI